MDELLTPEQAYRAMYRFVEAYWERGGRQPGELVLFMSYAEPGKWEPAEDNPVGSGDPAAWDDWLDAIKATPSN
jgi:hypothetical protein